VLTLVGEARFGCHPDARDEPEGSGRADLSCPQILPARSSPSG
jgi:hypothetical protein